MVSFMNTKLGFPYDSDYTEEDSLNDDIKTYEEYKIVKKEISKVTLGGKEYMKAELVMDINGTKGYLYLFYRKLDDNLMLKIEAGGISEKETGYFEDLFLEQ